MEDTQDRASADSDCIPHDGHGTHAHGDDCGHATIAHDDHVDYVHDTHRHAGHGGHWDEHSAVAAATPNVVGRPGGAG